MAKHPAHTHLRPSQQLRWLFFDLNSYFASVEQQERPELRGKPVVIVPSMTDSTCAIAASAEAKAFGIKTGTMIYEAKERCPDLICVLARHDIYVAYHHRIIEEVENHIPVTKTCSIDEAACFLWENDRTPEKIKALVQDIKQGLRDNIGECVKCSIGIAPNAFLAKTATDMQKPNGFVILEPKTYTEKLFALNLRDLCGIGVNIERRLLRAGIGTVEQFWNLSPKQARAVWGSVEGERFWYNLHGHDIPDKATQKRVVGHSRVLDPVHRASDKAYDIAQQLALKACARLRRYELYARKFSLGVRTIGGQSWGDEKTFSPTQDNFTVVKGLEAMWIAMQRDTHRGKLLKVSIMLYDLYKREEVTLDLFAATGGQNKTVQHTGLSVAMDALNKRYGANTVALGVCPSTSSGHLGTKIAFTRVPSKEEFCE